MNTFIALSHDIAKPTFDREESVPHVNYVANHSLALSLQCKVDGTGRRVRHFSQGMSAACSKVNGHPGINRGAADVQNMQVSA